MDVWTTDSDDRGENQPKSLYFPCNTGKSAGRDEFAQNVIAMMDALGRGDFATVEGLGHGVKGAGGSYGFQAITDIGAAVEQAAEGGDTDASRKWVGELSRYLDRVETISD